MTCSATAGPLLRWTRALVLVAVAMSTGTGFHMSADGLLPGPVVLLVLLAASTLAAAPLLGSPASTRRVVLLLVAWQALVHAALTALSGHRGAPMGHAEAGDHAHVAASSPTQHLVDDLTGPHAVMALGHVCAAALVGLWLAAGERAVWRLIGLAARPVRTFLCVFRAARLAAGGAWCGARVSAPRVRAHGDSWRLWFLVRAVPRRGPPVLA